MRRVAVVILVAVLVLSLASCDRYGRESVEVYLLRPIDASEAMGSTKVSISAGGTAAETAMRTLLDPQQVGDGLYSPYPYGVRLLSLKVEDGVAAVDLSEEYLRLDGVTLAEAESCTAMTLCLLDGVSGVRITVNGAPHPHGSAGVVTPDSIVTDEVGEVSLEREITVYFSSDESGRLEAEHRWIVLREGEAAEGYVIEELLRGPSQKGLSPLLPDGLELRGVAVEGDVCSLSFSHEFEQLRTGPVKDELAAVVSIANSIIESTSVNKVRFFIEGEVQYRGQQLGRYMGVSYPNSYVVRTAYLPSYDGEHIEPVDALVSVGSNKTTDRLLVEWLTDGPDGEGFCSVLPDGVELHSMTCTSALCHIDFSVELLENSTESSLATALRCIAHTLYKNDYARQGVDVSINGEHYALVTANADDIHPDFR